VELENREEFNMATETSPEITLKDRANEAYISYMKYKMDMAQDMHDSHEENFQENFQKGFLKGFQEGFFIGSVVSTIRFAQNAINGGVPIDKIVRLMIESLTEVENEINENNLCNKNASP
jgi:hypothetical protein